jgi:hypothetical protein
MALSSLGLDQAKLDRGLDIVLVLIPDGPK